MAIMEQLKLIRQQLLTGGVMQYCIAKFGSPPVVSIGLVDKDIAGIESLPLITIDLGEMKYEQVNMQRRIVATIRITAMALVSETTSDSDGVIYDGIDVIDGLCREIRSIRIPGLVFVSSQPLLVDLGEIVARRYPVFGQIENAVLRVVE